VVLEALRLLKAGGPAAATVTAVATTREEISRTGGGARTSASDLEAVAALVVDVTHATDYPGLDKRKHGEYRLGGGPTIGRGASLSNMVSDQLIEAAEAEKIPYSIEAASRDTHTDAEAIFGVSRPDWCRCRSATCTARTRWCCWRMSRTRRDCWLRSAGG
jgi:endoglucanase